MAGRDDYRWEANLQDLTEFYKLYGRFPTKADERKSRMGTDLADWIRNQLSAYRRGDLSGARVALLERYLGSAWKDFTEGKKVDEIPDIKDKSLTYGFVDFSISTLARKGIISDSKLRSFYRKKLFYYSDLEREGYLNLTNSQLAGLVRMDLPEDWMVGLYCYIVGRSLVKMYSAKSRVDFVNLRYLGNNLPPVMKRVLKDREIKVVQLKCSGLPGTEIAKTLNISTTRQREIFSRSVRKLRFYSDYYTYELCDGGWKLVIDGKRERRVAENSIAMRDVPLELGITELSLPDKLCILLERRGMHTVGDMIDICRAESNGYLRLDLLASSLDSIPQVGQKSKEAIVDGIRRCCENSDTRCDNCCRDF